ncbi:hypothetical protein HFO61_30490 [Rhizobium leguminosarum]|uniref:hypothetical protein n=1 Tax=Rhizobium leguminosarum TaxID=384 RepID=UPI001C9526F8|nr:hypothetical protein [Rhizobium leguminosarum]MBY5551075.1 hypothetical protein [Rhizobium leguminosarum]
MSSFKIRALAFSTAIGVCHFANAGGLVEDIGRGAVRGLTDTHNTVKKAIRDTHNTGTKAVNDGVNTLGKALNDVGDTIAKGADDSGDTIEQAAHDAGTAAEKALHDSGHALEDAGQFVKEHPWETVAVIAFVAGGAYLVVFQEYTLSLAVGEHVVATFTAAELGTASVAAGAGTALVAANKPASASDLYKATAEKEADVTKTKATPKPEMPKLNAPAPILADNPTDTQKLGFAYKVLQWTQVSQPVRDFDLDDYRTTLSPMEQKLIEARLTVETVPDSAADIAAKQQAQDRRNFAKDQLAERAKDLLTGKLPDPTDSAKDALLEALKPTLVGDGWSASRETMKSLIDVELYKYAVKRVPCLKTPTKPACLKAPIDGPVIQTVP